MAQPRPFLAVRGFCPHCLLLQLTPRVFDGHASDAVGKSPSLVNKINYSDLASILMDGGFDARKVRRCMAFDLSFRFSACSYCFFSGFPIEIHSPAPVAGARTRTKRTMHASPKSST